MSAIVQLIRSEPAVLWAGLVAAVFNAVIILLPSLGVHLSPEAQAALAVVVNAVMALIVRAQVTPVATLGIQVPPATPDATKPA